MAHRPPTLNALIARTRTDYNIRKDACAAKAAGTANAAKRNISFLNHSIFIYGRWVFRSAIFFLQSKTNYRYTNTRRVVLQTCAV